MRSATPQNVFTCLSMFSGFQSRNSRSCFRRLKRRAQESRRCNFLKTYIPIVFAWKTVRSCGADNLDTIPTLFTSSVSDMRNMGSFVNDVSIIGFGPWYPLGCAICKNYSKIIWDRLSKPQLSCVTWERKFILFHLYTYSSRVLFEGW